MKKEDKVNLEELKEIYELVRDRLLDEAEKRDFSPEYYYENNSGSEIPEYFSLSRQLVPLKIIDSRLFQIMATGSLDQLKELLDNKELFEEYLNEIFGTFDQFVIETQRSIEFEEAKEAA